MKRYCDNWVDPVKDKVAKDMGYIDSYVFYYKLKEGYMDAVNDLDEYVTRVAREYSKQIERYYIDEND